MEYDNILVAFDGSEASEHALSTARNMVEHGLADKLVVLMVDDPTEFDDTSFEIAARMANATVTSEAEIKLSELKAKAEKLTESYQDKVELITHFGKPQKVILRVAQEKGCGLISMGSRGLGAIRGALGSVSHAVLRDADIPVLITK